MKLEVTPRSAGPPGRHVFDLSGGHPALDLVNTLEGRLKPQPRERLGVFDDLIAFAEQAGLVSTGQARGLRGGASARPRGARDALAGAKRLRETLFEIFTAAARGLALPASSMARFNRLLPATFSKLRLHASGRSVTWRWSDPDALDAVHRLVVREAADLLTSARLSRVRLCEADDCAWLFLDASRNQSRRWCDMAVCGNRSKVRRFRQSTRRRC